MGMALEGKEETKQGAIAVVAARNKSDQTSPRIRARRVGQLSRGSPQGTGTGTGTTWLVEGRSGATCQHSASTLLFLWLLDAGQSTPSSLAPNNVVMQGPGTGLRGNSRRVDVMLHCKRHSRPPGGSGAAARPILRQGRQFVCVWWCCHGSVGEPDRWVSLLGHLCCCFLLLL